MEVAGNRRNEIVYCHSTGDPSLSKTRELAASGKFAEDKEKPA
jgi:hypothetical protein